MVLSWRKQQFAFEGLFYTNSIYLSIYLHICLSVYHLPINLCLLLLRGRKTCFHQPTITTHYHTVHTVGQFQNCKKMKQNQVLKEKFSLGLFSQQHKPDIHNSIIKAWILFGSLDCNKQDEYRLGIYKQHPSYSNAVWISNQRNWVYSESGESSGLKY